MWLCEDTLVLEERGSLFAQRHHDSSKPRHKGSLNKRDGRYFTIDGKFVSLSHSLDLPVFNRICIAQFAKPAWRFLGWSNWNWYKPASSISFSFFLTLYSNLVSIIYQKKILVFLNRVLICLWVILYLDYVYLNHCFVLFFFLFFLKKI